MSTKSRIVDVVQAKTPNQSVYLDAMKKSIVTLCIGPAGCGKTYLACAEAAKALREKKVRKIIITRPLITCGEDMGAFPGDATEKSTPYMRAIIDAFSEFFDKDELRAHINLKTIEVQPLELMRGASISNAFIICDEAQNAKYTQIFMLLTRFAKNTKIVITGDPMQSDIKGQKIDNALLQVERRFAYQTHKDISIVRLTREDCVRHYLIGWIIDRLSPDYNPDDPSTLPANEPEKQEYEDESDEGFNSDWRYGLCDGCDSELWYDNGSPSGFDLPDVDQITCWKCNRVLDIIPGDELTEVAKSRKPNCLRSQEKPPFNIK